MKWFWFLRDPAQAHASLQEAWIAIKPYLLAGHRLEIEIHTERRNSDQNAKLHAMLTDISRSVEWAGKKRDVEVWKRLLVAAWLRARGESIEVLPALDGKGIDVVFRRTSELTKTDCAELIEFIQAWAAEHAVECV